MAGQLITLPMRLSIRVASAFVRAGVSLTARALSLAGGEQEHRADVVPTAPAPDRPAARPAPAPPPRREPRQEPTHVSEEPVVVAQFAEPGAEDGAGARVVVEEPWPGYTEMNAKEVIARVRGADSAALAAVELYESSNRNRQTVLGAVRRELRSKNGST